MQLLQANTPSTRRYAVLLGYFDAMHVGHRALLAEAAGLPTALFTFEGDLYGALGKEGSTLYPDAERAAIARSWGIEALWTLPANAETLSISGAGFLQELLSLPVSKLICGHDFRFGADHLTAEDLAQWCGAHDMAYAIVPPVLVDGERVSTSHIRTLLSAGQVAEAKRLLGRPYHVAGWVCRGRGEGHVIGFPTANIPIADTPLAHGVYAVRVQVRDEWYRGIANVGPHPTVGDMRQNIEVHILYFGRDIYNERITVAFEHWLRSIRNYGSVDELVSQLEIDRDRAIQLLKA